MSRSDVLVLVPFYKTEIAEDEALSLEHLETHLAHLPGFFVGPSGVRAPSDALPTLELAPCHFSSVAAYSRLLLSADFYQLFSDWKHVLIYQLDCLVFSGQLTPWVEQNVDYVGAPFRPSPRASFSHVGNGGLSLRSIAAFTRVLERGPSGTELLSALSIDLPELWSLPTRRRLKTRLRIARTVIRGARYYSSRYTLNEDLFWSNRARIFDRSFRVASVKEGLAFSFEREPRLALAANGGRLPFGCHAWNRYDPEFWHSILNESSV